MRRRRFIKAAGAGAAWLGLGSAGSLIGASCSEVVPWPGTWTWIHGRRDRTAADWRALLSRAGEAGVQGVLVSGRDATAVEAAHNAGLQLHRWVWTLNRSGDGWVKENHPEWFSVSRDGNSSLQKPPYVRYYQWLCPTRQSVREYLQDFVDGVSREQGVAGIHLDYIRHPDVILPVGLWSRYDLVQDREHPEFDFCYCDVCRETFQARGGRDPLDLPDPTADVEWRRFRWDSVTELVGLLANTVRSNGRSITAAVFPTPTVARQLVRQAWEEWDVDAVFPMIYHGFYEEPVSWIESATREGVEALGGRIPLYSGLYLPQLSPEELGEAVMYAQRGGATGVSLFELGRLSREHAARLREVLSS